MRSSYLSGNVGIAFVGGAGSIPVPTRFGLAGFAMSLVSTQYANKENSGASSISNSNDGIWKPKEIEESE